MATITRGTLSPHEQLIIRLIARTWRTPTELSELLNLDLVAEIEPALDRLIVDHYLAIGGLTTRERTPQYPCGQFLYRLGTSGAEWLTLQSRITQLDAEIASHQQSDRARRTNI